MGNENAPFLHVLNVFQIYGKKLFSEQTTISNFQNI